MSISVIKNVTFLRLWASQVSSLVTINLLNFLVMVRVFERTNSTVASSFIWVAYAIPAIITGPFAAAAVDLYDRRKILIVSNLIQTVIVAVYAFAFERYLFISYGVIAFYSLINQLYVPAETAYLTKIIPKHQLVTANSIFFVSQQGATILAFGLAGLMYEIVGFKYTTLIAALWLLLAFVATLWLPKEKEVEVKKIESIENRIFTFLVKMKDGFIFIRKNKYILYPFLFLVFLQIAMSVLVVNLPAIAIEIVKTKPSLSGLLVVIPAGLGAVLATVFITKLIKSMGSKKLVRMGLIGIGASFLVVSLLLPLFSFWIGRMILVISFLVAGVSFVSMLVPTMTYMQTKTPPEFAGRVFGNFWFVTTAATVFPVIFSATVTEVLGASTMLILLGSSTLAGFFLTRHNEFKNSL